MNDLFKVIPMESHHVDNVVQLHLYAFPGFFLSSLGKQFLSEFYKGVVNDSTGISKVYMENDIIFGFVAGSDQPNGFYSRLIIRKWWKFFIAAIPAFVSDPKIIFRLYRAFSLPNEKLPYPNCGTLMSIAVNPSHQGKGIGKLLVDSFINEAKGRGIEVVNLKTDAINNERVNDFYKIYGFKLYRTYSTPEGRLMNEYVFLINTKTNIR